jgi:hypothetical protein
MDEEEEQIKSVRSCIASITEYIAPMGAVLPSVILREYERVCFSFM